MRDPYLRTLIGSHHGTLARAVHEPYLGAAA
jgi:hypothetical protein